MPGALVQRSLESGTGVVPPMVYAALLLVAGVLGLLVVDRLLLAAEARGWINAAVEEVQEEEDRGAPPPLF